jgi:hypothetical protein
MAALLVDRAVVEISHLADRLRQPAQRGDLGLAGVLLRPHPLEFRIAVDVGARRPFPAAAEAGQPGLEIEKERVALLLAVVADIDAGRALLVHDPPHGGAPGAIDLGVVGRVPACAGGIKPGELPRPRQAAGVGRQDSARAALHRVPAS